MIRRLPSNIITIAPVGGMVENRILEHLTGFILDRCGLECRIETKVEIPEQFYDTARGQYNAKEILKYLIEVGLPDSLKFIGITELDLFVPVLKYVYGLSQISGPFSIVSLHRLYLGFYNEPPDPNVFLIRTEKTTLHELGHAFGLTHCREKKCVMFSSSRIADTDYKESCFCPTCLELFKWQRDNPR